MGKHHSDRHSAGKHHLPAQQSNRIGGVVTFAVAPVLTASVGVALGTTGAAAADKSELTCQVGVASGVWRAPLQGAYRVTSPFGPRIHPIAHVERLHAGIDLVSGVKDSPVLAAGNGVVVHAGPYGGLGNAVEIKHDGGISTIYGHLASIDPKIQLGRQIPGGQQVGIEGRTGDATGVHLHFEVHLNGKPVDPVPFMKDRSASLDGRAIAASQTWVGGEKNGFLLPAAGPERKASIGNKPLTIPADVKANYVKAAQKYNLPWTLLAGIGMEETGHGRNTNISTAGARGLMQFMPGTWDLMGVDGDGDGKADILNPADSAMSAANYLTKAGVAGGPEGVRKALFAYNHADWYVNDVLHYAAEYGGGAIDEDCSPGVDTKKVVSWAKQHLGDKHRLGAIGPHTWDSSSFTQAAYRQAGIELPRTAQQQRDFLARGNGMRVTPGQEQPGDLIFYDSYRGRDAIGHVLVVADPVRRKAIAAATPREGVVYDSYAKAQKKHHIFEIWRVNAPQAPELRVVEPAVPQVDAPKHSSKRVKSKSALHGKRAVTPLKHKSGKSLSLKKKSTKSVKKSTVRKYADQPVVKKKATVRKYADQPVVKKTSSVRKYADQPVVKKSTSTRGKYAAEPLAPKKY